MRLLSTTSEIAECLIAVQCTGDEGVCAVCQSEFEAGESATKMFRCGHIYHVECIEGWLLGCKSECPVCKTALCKPAAEVKAEEEVEEGVVADDGSEYARTIGQLMVLLEEVGEGLDGTAPEWQMEALTEVLWVDGHWYRAVVIGGDMESGYLVRWDGENTHSKDVPHQCIRKIQEAEEGVSVGVNELDEGPCARHAQGDHQLDPQGEPRDFPGVAETEQAGDLEWNSRGWP